MILRHDYGKNTRVVTPKKTPGEREILEMRFSAETFLKCGIWMAAAILFVVSTIAPGPAAYGQSGGARITGMAHMAYYVSDLKSVRDYYEGFLGFHEAFTLKNANGPDQVVFIKINDHQYIELYNEPVENYGYIHDAGFETNDANAMRDYLAAMGVTVPEKATKDATGNLSFEMTEPSGFSIQIVQYLADSMTGGTRGKFMPATRISDHIDHIGLLIKDKDVTWKFYIEAFGFVKQGDGSKMAIPDSDGRFEVGWGKRAELGRGGTA